MPASQTGHILVLDDDPNFRSLVRQILEMRGFSVVEAKTPDEASALYSPKDTALAIVDYRLPHIDGMTWIGRLRESGKNTPIVFCSAIPCDMATFNWLRNILKVSLILQKPIIPESFVQQIEALLPGYEKHFNQEGVGNHNSYEDGREPGDQLEELDQSKLRRRLQIEKAVKAARSEYLKELEKQWGTLTQLIELHNNDKLRTDTLVEARHIAHRIRGTAGTVGLVDVGVIAAKIDDLLHNLDAEEDTAQEVIWSEIIRELGRGHNAVVAAQLSDLAEEDTQIGARVLMLACDFDAETAVQNAACQQLAHIDCVENLSGVEAHLSRFNVDAVVVDLGLNDVASVLKVCAEMRQLHDNRVLPLGFICDTGAIPDELACLYAGASTVIERPLNEFKMKDALTKLLAVSRPNQPRVLAIDDDEILCQFVKNVLTGEGIETTTSTNPVAALEIIDECKPDLILLDVIMPALTGYEVCRAIRQISDYKETPILFLTSKTSEEARTAAFAVGATDFITKPVLADELTRRVTHHLQESFERRHGPSERRDSGILGGDAFMLFAAEQLKHHNENAESMVVALLDIDDYSESKIVQGRFAMRQVSKRLEQMLLQHFKAEDLRAQWSESGHALAINRCSSEIASKALDMLASEFKTLRFPGKNFSFTATFSVGVADSMHDGTDFEELIRTAFHRMNRTMREKTGVLVK